MLKKNYYCLVAGLPDLLFKESNRGLSVLDFKAELKQQLSKSDFELVKLLFLPNDHENILNLLFDKNEAFNLLGNYQKELLETEITDPVDLPTYLCNFINWIRNQENAELNLETENKLHGLYYEYAISSKNSFLNRWFSLDLNIKNILTAFNCKQYDYPVDKHLIKIKQDESVYPLLQNKQLKQELFEDEVPFADQIFRIAELPIKLEEKEKAIDKLLWTYLDEETAFHYFTIEKILSFVIKLGIVERWMKLDSEPGKALLNKLIEELKLSYTFPEEFSIVK